MGTDHQYAFHPHSTKTSLRSLRLCERSSVRLESLTYVRSKPQRGGISSASREAAARNSCGRQPIESLGNVATPGG